MHLFFSSCTSSKLDDYWETLVSETHRCVSGEIRVTLCIVPGVGAACATVIVKVQLINLHIVDNPASQNFVANNKPFLSQPQISLLTAPTKALHRDGTHQKASQSKAQGDETEQRPRGKTSGTRLPSIQEWHAQRNTKGWREGAVRSRLLYERGLVTNAL